MTEKEMYNLINNQNNQQSNGFAVNEKERGISGVFSEQPAEQWLCC